MERQPLVSVIIPIRDSRGMLEACLQSVAAQDYPRDKMELIVPDGNSADDGPDIARRFGAAVVPNPGLMIAPAREAGFAASHGEIVAFTDADCIVDKDWLKNAVKYFDDPKVGAVGGPSPVPAGQGPFAEGIRWLFRLATVLARAAHVEDQRETEDVKHIPGCNLLCRRSALAEVFPLHWTTTSGEDLQTGRLLLLKGYRLLRVPDVRVTHYKRTTARAFFRQMRSYGRGRLRLGKLDGEWLYPAHIVCGFAIPLGLLGLAVLAALGPYTLGYGLGVACGLSLGFCAWAVLHGAKPSIFWSAPAALAVGTAGWSVGFLEELLLGPPAGRT